MKKIILCVCVYGGLCVCATSAVVGSSSSSSSKKRRKIRKKIKSKDFICVACSMLIRADKPKGLCGRGNSASLPVCVCELYAPLYYIITSNNDYTRTHTRITWCSLEMALILLQIHEWKLLATHSTVAAPQLLPCSSPAPAPAPFPSLVENAKRAPQINKFASHDTTQNNKRQWQIFFNVHFIIIMSS